MSKRRKKPKSTAARRFKVGDRVRMVFALTGDESLPGPDDKALAIYYGYLATELSFPFEAKYYGEWAAFDRSRPRIVRAVGLGGDFDVDQGILCEVRTSTGDDLVPLVELEIRRSDPNHQLVDDFAAWFAGTLVSELDEDDVELDEVFRNCLKIAYQTGRLRHDGGIGIGDKPVRVEAGWLGVGLIYLEIVAFAASYGAVVGSAVATMSWAKWAACMAGGLLGVVHAVSQASSAQRVWSRTVPRFRKPMGGVVGLMIGTLAGAFFGIMAVAFVGSLLGCAAGLLLERLFGRGKKSVLHLFPGWVLFAAAWGVAAQAFYVKPLEATAGLRYGTLTGLAAGLLFCLASVPLAFLTTIRKPSSSPTPE